MDADRGEDAPTQLSSHLDMLRSEIWPVTTHAEPITKRDREDILGYSPDGV